MNQEKFFLSLPIWVVVILVILGICAELIVKTAEKIGKILLHLFEKINPEKITDIFFSFSKSISGQSLDYCDYNYEEYLSKKQKTVIALSDCLLFPIPLVVRYLEKIGEIFLFFSKLIFPHWFNKKTSPIIKALKIVEKNPF